MKEFSTEQLLEIVRSLRSDADVLMRRKQPRVGLRHSIRVVPCDDTQTPVMDQACRAWVRDVSRRGLGLLIDRRLATGTTILLEIHRENPSGTAHLLGRVTRCEHVTREHHHVGIELILDTPQELIADYLKRARAA